MQSLANVSLAAPGQNALSRVRAGSAPSGKNTRRWLMPLLLLAAFAPSPVRAQTPTAKPWVSTWGTGTSSVTNDRFFVSASYNGNNVFNNQVVRLIVHASVGGNQVRIRLSNELGTAPVTVAAAHVALSDGSPNLIAGSDRTLTFRGGDPSVTIPAGAPALSDGVQLDVATNATLAISLYLPEGTTVTTGHPDARQNNYVSPAESGDVSGETVLPLDATSPTLSMWPLLSGVEVRAKGARTLVAFGSSVTNGTLSTVGADGRFTDYLSQRFARHDMPVGIVNASVVANALTRVVSGGAAEARFDRDVLARPGVEWVLIGDIIGVEVSQSVANATAPQTADQIIGNVREYIARVHSQQLKAYAATLTPMEGASGYSDDYNAKREAVNAFIRGGGFDGYVDFDAAVRDPSDPARILPAYDGGDHHHFNDAGYKVLAGAFDLTLFE